MGWLRTQQQVVWTRQRVGILIAIVVAISLVLAVAEVALLGACVDLEVFGYDVSIFVAGLIGGVAMELMMRRWQDDDRA